MSNNTPKSDYMFKKIFGKKGNEDILKDLLKSILKIEIEKIEIIKDVELEKEYDEDKYGIIDIKAKIDDIWIDIEMQVIKQYSIEKRLLYYWSKLYWGQLQRGNKFDKLQKTIVIGILDFNIYSHNKCHSKMIMINENTKSRVFKEIEIHIVELRKYTPKRSNSKLDEWISFITRDKEGLEMAVKTNVMVKKAEEEYEYLTGDAAERRKQELRRKKILDDNTRMYGAKKEGIEIGMQKGIEKGMKKGKEEIKYNIARKLLLLHFDIKDIAKITGLSENKIKGIK